MTKSIKMTTRIDPKLFKLLGEEAKRRDRPVAYLVNELIEQHFAAKGLCPSPLDHAKDHTKHA